MDDLKQFRQWSSVSLGHQENFEIAGVETKTGRSLVVDTARPSITVVASHPS